jgi:hypothetical protein
LKKYPNKKKLKMRKIVSLLSMLMVLSSLTFAQTRSISGKVTDAKGNPVPAASIKKSKGEGAVAADQNGNFKINVKNGDVLLISSVNFSTARIPVTASNDYTVALTESVNVMDEIVVTAGGIKSKRKEIGTATTVIQAAALTAGKATLQVFKSVEPVAV